MFFRRKRKNSKSATNQPILENQSFTSVICILRYRSQILAQFESRKSDNNVLIFPTLQYIIFPQNFKEKLRKEMESKFNIFLKKEPIHLGFYKDQQTNELIIFCYGEISHFKHNDMSQWKQKHLMGINNVIKAMNPNNNNQSITLIILNMLKILQTEALEHAYLTLSQK